jgi:hypothetical protein
MAKTMRWIALDEEKANDLLDLGDLEYWCRLRLGASLCRFIESILSLLAGHLGAQESVPIGARITEIRMSPADERRECTHKNG